MKVLAFDTAISTGVAVGCPGEKPLTFTVDLGKASWDVRFSKALRMTEHLIRKFQPDLVVIEAPAAGNFTNQDLVGLTVCVRGQAARMGVPVKMYYANSVRKHFLGRALKASDFPGKNHAAAKKAIKSQIIARCIALGWEVKGGDAADAAALWDLACAMERPSHAMTSIGGIFR